MQYVEKVIVERVEKVIKKLEKHIPHLEFYNTICQPTTSKQQEARSLPLKNEVMIVIGSKNQRKH